MTSQANSNINYAFIPMPVSVLFDTRLSQEEKIVLSYGIHRQGIPNWKFNKTDICKQLTMSMYAVKKALTGLMKLGYASYERLKFRFTQWFFYPNPLTEKPCRPREIKQVENQTVLQVENQTGLERKKILKRKKQPPAPRKNEKSKSLSGELIYPAQLTPAQKKAAKHVIRKVKQPELQQPVLFALAYAMAQNKVKSPVAYLNGLVSRANNGTFETKKTGSGTKVSRPIIPIWQGHKAAPPIDNASFFQDLVNKFGSKAAKAIPAGMSQ